MGSAKTKVRIFSIALTSVLIMIVFTNLIRFDIVQDYYAVGAMLSIVAVSILVFIASVYAALVLFIEGLILKWGNRLFDALDKENKNES